MDVCSVEEEVSECVMGHLRYVFEGPLRVSVREFMVPDDVLNMRTTAVKWNIAGLWAFCGVFLLRHEEKWKGKTPLLVSVRRVFVCSAS